LKILVTGSQGQLGSEFRLISQSSVHDFYLTDSAQLDITNFESLNTYFKTNSIDIILNCAAYTAVDKAEEEKENAFTINKEGVKNLVKICEKQNVKLIHFSTDYVFDGRNFQPYKETDEVNPQSVYGKSKLAGEQLILDSNISALIVRTSWLYSNYGNNFVKSIIKLGKERDSLNIVFDQIGSPTNAADLAEATMLCISQQDKWNNKQEIYHFSNEGVCSWYDFTLEIFNTFGIDCKVKPLLSKDYPTKARRPHFSVLDKSKFKSDFNYEIKHWKETFQTLNI